MTRRLSSFDRLVAGREIIVVCGPGGVGKTTTAAAIGVSAALRSTAKVLVLTVDPARRLGDALHLALDDAPRRIDAELLSPIGRRARGELWAAMVDAPAAWDALIRREAPSSASAEAITSNAFYTNITRRFAHSHEYIAMDRLFELHSTGEYDLVVLDTPPSTDALDLLDAPEQMAAFFSSSLLRLLSTSSHSRLAMFTTRSFSPLAERVLGTALIEEVREFLSLFQQMRVDFVERSRAVAALVREPRTSFAVVTTLETTTAREAARLSRALELRGMHLSLLVANKVLPFEILSDQSTENADRLEHNARAVATEIATKGPSGLRDVATNERVLHVIADNASRFAALAMRQAELLEELAVVHEEYVTVPHLLRDIVDIEGLIAVGEHLSGPSARRASA